MQEIEYPNIDTGTIYNVLFLQFCIYVHVYTRTNYQEWESVALFIKLISLSSSLDYLNKEKGGKVEEIVNCQTTSKMNVIDCLTPCPKYILSNFLLYFKYIFTQDKFNKVF